MAMRVTQEFHGRPLAGMRAGRRAITGAFLRNAISLAIGALIGVPVGAYAGQPGQILLGGTLPQVRGVVYGQATVNAPVAIPGGGGNRLTIDQTSQKTIIDWNSFDIARGSEVQFNQPNAGSSALNRIFSLDPSVIQGKLTANGQIILINQNGILFDGGSQVNVHSLIASTLAITDDIFKNGISTSNSNGALRFDGVTGYTKVEVAAGGPASAAPATLTSDPAGNIILLAPNVANNGIIRSPDGQVILAAGKSVLLFQPQDQNSAQMRGYFVQVTADKTSVNLTSLVTNLGQISADRGNVTLAALAVNQLNLISAKTAVNRNGSIWLIGQDRTVLGKGSITATPLDLADTTRLADDQDYSTFRASIRVEGNTILHQGTMVSHSGNVTFNTLPAATFDPAHSSGVTAIGTTTNTAPTRIFLDQGSTIDVSGDWVDLPISKNLVTFRVTSNDLKDTAAQKGGPLLGQTVTVDVRQGSPLFDISGYTGAIQRGVAEKATTGGNISLLSQGDLVIQRGALLDVAGGGYQYASGALATTKLLAGAKLYDIGAASPTLRYDSVLVGGYTRTHGKWGVTESFASLLSLLAPVEAGYRVGKAAGAITLDGTGIAMNGTLRSDVTVGRTQTAAISLPAGGQLTIGIADNTRASSYLLNTMRFTSNAAVLPSGFDPLADALPTGIAGTLLLPVGAVSKPAISSSAAYIQQGFGSLAIGVNGSAELPAGMLLALPANGNLFLAGSAIAIDGTISVPGGSIALKAFGTGVGNAGLPTVRVGQGAHLSAAGLWINDRLDAMPASKFLPLPRVTQGGKVSVSSEYAITLGEGSLIDVSGGAIYTSKGALLAGDAGSISLRTGAGGGTLFDGRLTLGGELRGDSIGKGGKLDISAPRVDVGRSAADAQTLALGSAFFQQGGFTQYTIGGYYSVTVADGVAITPAADNYVVDLTRASTQRSGTDLGGLSRIARLSAWQRTPASLSLIVNADQLVPGTGLLIGHGASIVTDPGAAVLLSSRSALDIYGTVSVPAGSISATVNSDQPNPLRLHLGPDAALLAQGQFMPQPNSQGLHLGQVTRGGTVTLSSVGDVIADTGSLIDVSGISALAQVPVTSGGAAAYAPVTLNGDAGTVAVSAFGAVALSGQMRGRAAGQAAGGSFALDLKGGNVVGQPARRIVLSVDGSAAQGGGTIDAVFAADVWQRSGFDKVRLFSTDLIVFNGDVNLRPARSIELSAPVFDAQGSWVSIASNRVRLDGPSVDASNSLRLLNHPTARGTGVLEVNAGLIDLVGGITVNGVSRVTLSSAGDIRAAGLPVRVTPAATPDQVSIPDSLAGYFVTPGDISLIAAQVYPTTLSQFRFSSADVTTSGATFTETSAAGGRIKIARSGSAVLDALSAGGAITFAGDAILNDGVIKAPLGQVNLRGASSVTLGAGSLVSVSGVGLVVPFGETVNGQALNYGGIPNVSLPAKTITVNAPKVAINPGATLEVSGGGEVQAADWVPGIGGSKDVLAAPNTYAILPSMRLVYAPSDTDLLGRDQPSYVSDIGIYNAVYLAGGNGIAAGYYPLLPGYYALLPGAYKITPQTGTALAGIQPGRTLALSDGTSVLAGKFAVAGTGIQAQTWSAFALESGAQVRREAEYRLSDSSFFAAQAATNGTAVLPLPQDAGRVSIGASTGLMFAPTLLGTPASGGNGAQVDISAPDITVVSGSLANGGGAGVQLDTDKLSSLNASLLLGGTRADAAGGTSLSVGANTVTIATGADLRGPEIIVAATGSIDVQSGATVRGQGTFAGAARDLQVTGANGNGALLRASSGNQVNVTRSGSADRSTGTLTIENGALVTAARSLILDSTKSTQSFGSLAVADGGFVSLGAGNIRIGNAPASADSLMIGPAELASFGRLDTIALRSYTSIDFYGDVALGADAFNRITLDAAAINGIGGGAASVRARRITLQNTGANGSAATAGTGSLALLADSVILGGGSKALSGFAAVTIFAKGDITGSATGDLRTGSELTLVSTRVTGAPKSDQSIIAVDDSRTSNTYYKVTLQQPPAPLAGSSANVLGAKLAIIGSSIDNSGDVELPAGSVTLTATGPGGITLRNGSRLFAGGAAKVFAPSTAFAPAGTVSLIALRGDVVSTAGSSIDVSGAVSGGDAGILSLEIGGTGAAVRLDGILNGTAASGYRQGSAVLNLTSAGNFSVLNAKLNQGGFSEARDIRVRSGDVTIAGENPFTQRPGDIVVAHHFKLAVDQGSITVGGTIDASGTTVGGSIALDAMNDVNLADGSFLLARGMSAAVGTTDAYSHGGSVKLSSRSGTLNMASGAVVDVSANAVGKSNGGNVILSARRTTNTSGADADVAMNLAGTVSLGAGVNGGQAGSVTVEGVHGYEGIADTAIASNSGSAVMTDYKLFVGNSQSIISRLTGQGLTLQGSSAASAMHVSGGVELRSSGDMVVSSAWDLTSSDWMPSADPGRLTLRAAGTLSIESALGFPNDNLAATRSWSIRLAGGADLNAANALAVLPSSAIRNSGDVVLVNNGGSQVGKVRTGTGSIDVVAGRDIVIQDPPGAAPTRSGDSILLAPAAVIYTAGLPGAGGGVTNLFPTSGGDISLTAQRNVIGAAKQQQWVNDWLRRTTSSLRNLIAGNPAAWWVNRATFRHNVGALGGGDVGIDAGGDVVNLSAMVPTTGQISTDPSGQTTLDVRGGGNLDLRAAGDVVGGEYLAARGAGRIAAGGSIGKDTALALHLMGEGGNNGPSGGSIKVTAGRDVRLQNVSNPTLLALSSIPGNTGPGFQNIRSAFFSYSASDRLDLISVSGNIDFPGRAVAKLSKVSGSASLDTQWSDIVPSHFSAIALQGDITGGHVQPTDLPVRLYPSPDSSLLLLAQGSMSNVAFEALDVIPGAQSQWGWNKAFQVLTERSVDVGKFVFGAQALSRYVTPGSPGQYSFVVAAQLGSISDSTLALPRQAVVSAGTNLHDVRLDLQNLAAGDLTVVKAGQDLRYVPTYVSGIADKENSGGYIRMGGPGRMLIQAGRNIDLGTSEGITAGGNNYNLSLPASQSAQLAIAAGVIGDFDISSLDQLFADLKAAGIARDAALGEQAIQRVFSGSNTQPGNITMFFSAIKTQGGSGIDLLVPEGDINAGLPTPGAGGNIGIYTTFGGGIRTYLSGNFNVNQSKVMTLDGGDILLYSSKGNIDAGRGARDSRTTQAPQRVAILDDKGNPTGLFTFVPPVDASGSGIRSLTFDPDGPGPLASPKPGDIFLFAPKGFIDAGEAGVSSAGNIFVAALQVLNANNFSAAGSSAGVPVALNTGISNAAAGAGNVGASAAKSAEEVTKNLASSAATNTPKEVIRPSVITVELLGIGEEKSREEAKEK